MHSSENIIHGNTLSGTIGGTLLVIFNLHAEEVTKTALLAAIGAMVSFAMSYSLTAIGKWMRNRSSST